MDGSRRGLEGFRKGGRPFRFGFDTRSKIAEILTFVTGNVTPGDPVLKGGYLMTDSRKWMRIAGLVLHVLIGALLVFSGAMKLFGPPPPPELLEHLKKIRPGRAAQADRCGRADHGDPADRPLDGLAGGLAHLGVLGRDDRRSHGNAQLVRVPGGAPGTHLGRGVPEAARDVQQLPAGEPPGLGESRDVRLAAGSDDLAPAEGIAASGDEGA